MCPCNQWLNALSRTRLGVEFDRDGAVAQTGTPQQVLVERWHRALRDVADSGRSLGSGDERVVGDDPQTATPDVLASAVHAIATCLLERVVQPSVSANVGAMRPQRLVLAGGGTRNQALVAAISACAAEHGIDVHTSDRYGVDPQQREAIGMAVLGALIDDGVCTLIPQVTNSPLLDGM